MIKKAKDSITMWIYIQSILVYLLLMIFMIILSKEAIATKKYGYVVGAIILYAVIFGMRYGVGMDYFGYLDLYETYSNNGYFNNAERIEIGFKWLVKVTSLFHSSFIYFGLIAFINLFFMTIGFKKNLKLFPYLFCVFMLTGAWMFPANLARQCIAVALWACALKYAVDQKILKHYICLLVAILFHYSAVVLIPLYFLIIKSNNWFKNIKVELILLSIALLLMKLGIVEDVIQKLDTVFLYLGYDIYMSGNYDDLLNREVALGLGFFIKLLINVVNIYNSEKVKIWVQSSYYNVVYSLYFVGVLIGYVFVNSEIIGRINLYFTCFTYIVSAFTLYYSYVKNKQLLKVLTLSLVMMHFVAIMYKASTNWNLFVFKGQKEYYYLHKDHER